MANRNIGQILFTILFLFPFFIFPISYHPSCRKDQSTVTGRISPIYEKYYKLMKVLYIFPIIFKVKLITNLI